MIEDFNKLKQLYNSIDDSFLFVDFDLYKRWKYLIILIVILNKNYKLCEIYRKKYKVLENFVVVGLKWNGKKVKRRTNGFAKDYISKVDKPKCIYCECLLTDDISTADHIVSISSGGSNAQVNLMVCCKDCNGERGDISFNSYLRMKNPKYKNVKYVFI
jgi:5-methylcytosine-specific restriction endonuclease McrA